MTTTSSNAQSHTQASDTTYSADQVVWIDGKHVPAGQASVSVFDHGLLYGDGIFEGIRAYNNRVLKLGSHLKRFYDGARAICLEIPYTPEELTHAVKDTLAANNITDGYIRLVVTRGTGTLGLNPFLCKRATVFAITANIAMYPQELYDTGLEIITAGTIRNHPAALDPRIKSLNYLNNIMAKIEGINANVLETLMLNHQGQVAECTGDNIFRVNYEGDNIVLRTPPASAGALEGITRALVMDIARDAGYIVEESNMTRYDLMTADEVFLTGTAAEVIAVTKLDQRPINDGKPGRITNDLIKRFRQVVANAPED